MSFWVDSPSTRSDVTQDSSTSSRLLKNFIAPDFEESSLYPPTCPKCAESNQVNKLRFMFVNEEEAVFKCEGTDCLYPFREFIFKNFTDNTVYRYEIEEFTEPPELDTNTYDGTIEDLSFQVDEKLDIASPGTPYTVDFDLDSVLEDDSVSSFGDQFNDIKNWLEEIVDEKKGEFPDNIEKILAEKFDNPAPRKLKKCLEFVKNEFAKREIKKTEKLEVIQVTKKETSSELSPLDVLKVIKSSGSIPATKLKIEKKSQIAREPLVQKKQPIDKKKKALPQKKIKEPKCFREEKKICKQDVQQEEVKEAKIALPEKEKIKEKPKGRNLEDQELKDPPADVRRSQRIRTKKQNKK